MGRIINQTKVKDSNLSFTGKREVYAPMPIPLRYMVRKWCNINGVFMSQDGSYITIVEEIVTSKKRNRNVVLKDGVKTIVSSQENTKKEIVRLYLNYHKSEDGTEYVIASNARKQKSINITGMMAVEHQIQNLSFTNEVMDTLNANILELKND